MTTNNWLDWAREIQALGQTGLAFSENQYDIERYRRMLEIAAEIVAAHTSLKVETLIENFQQQQGYATPKVDVRGAVVRDGKILMVRERQDGRWSLPGGWADVGDVPSKAAEREVLEESGFQVQPTKIVGVYDANRDGRPLELYHAFKIIYLCKIIAGKPTASYETLSVDFFDFNDLPPLSINRTSERHLNDVLSHSQNPDLPTVFD